MSEQFEKIMGLNKIIREKGVTPLQCFKSNLAEEVRMFAPAHCDTKWIDAILNDGSRAVIREQRADKDEENFRKYLQLRSIIVMELEMIATKKVYKELDDEALEYIIASLSIGEDKRQVSNRLLLAALRDKGSILKTDLNKLQDIDNGKLDDEILRQLATIVYDLILLLELSDDAVLKLVQIFISGNLLNYNAYPLLMDEELKSFLLDLNADRPFFFTSAAKEIFEEFYELLLDSLNKCYLHYAHTTKQIAQDDTKGNVKSFGGN